jgi:hypothetical protein
MRNMTLTLGAAAVLAACGGLVSEEPPALEPVAAPPSPGGGADPGNLGQVGTVRTPELVAGGLERPTSIVVDDRAVYFTTDGTTLSGRPSINGSLAKVALDGGDTLLLTVDAIGSGYRTLASDGESLFFSTADGRILKISRDGGPVTELVSGRLGIAALAVDKDSVYFTVASDSDGEVARVPTSGGATENLATGQRGPSAVAFDDANIYWANTSDGSVMKAPKAGGAPTALATAQASPCGLSVSQGQIVWTNAAADGAVMKLAIAGGTPETLAGQQVAPCSVAADLESVYFAPNRIAGPLMRVARTGGAPAALAADATPAETSHNTVAVNDRYVYWTTRDAVLRLAK